MQGNIFEILFIFPITNLLVMFYKLLEAIHFPYALGFAIISLTIFIRIILYPFVTAQIKASHKMQKITPHLNSLKEKHKNDKKRLQEETMRLYKEYGVNPAAGCLPLIIQLPVIWSLYNVLSHTVAAHSLESIQKINKILYFPFLKLDRVWDTSFLGLPLFETPSKLISSHWWIIVIIILTGVFQFILSKMMIYQQADEKKEKKDQQNKPSDFQSALQTQSLFMFPVMIAFFSYSLPIGLSLYWNTFTLFGILQQYLLVGWGGLVPWLTKIGIYGNDNKKTS